MLRRLFAISIVCSLSAPIAASAQDPASALAGARRPNLKVLQTLPEAQLFPVMNLVADSLGVRCDYCHVQATPNLTKTPSNVGGWVWDRDDKAPKRTARDMMRMVVDLNAGPFKGTTPITCYTCHRGSTRPGRTPPLPPAGGAATTPAPPPLPSADRVWANYLSAVGPIEAPAAGVGTVISGWDDRSEGRYGKVDIVVSGTDRYRITLTTADGLVRQGVEGDAAWAATNDRVQRLSPADAERMRRIAMRYWPVKTRPANLQVTGIERIGDRDAYVAAAKLDPATTWTLYFDAVTGLLRREMTTTQTMLVPLQEQVDYEDYRNVDGVLLPFRVQTSDGAPYSTVTRTFLEIRRNVPVDASLFRPPQ